VIFAGSGNVTVHGGSGSDLIAAGSGNATLDGGRGADVLETIRSTAQQLAGGDGGDALLSIARHKCPVGGQAMTSLCSRKAEHRQIRRQFQFRPTGDSAAAAATTR